MICYDEELSDVVLLNSAKFSVLDCCYRPFCVCVFFRLLPFDVVCSLCVCIEYKYGVQ